MRLLKIGIVAGITISLLVWGLLWWDSKNSDNFYNCIRTFKTDKEKYKPGDTIKLTVVLATTLEKKEVKIFQDFENLDINLSLLRPCDLDKPEFGDCSFPSLMTESRPKKVGTNVLTVTIDNDNPYEHTFFGMVSYDTVAASFTITFKDYGYSCSFRKQDYEESNSLRFYGIWYPIKAEIGASLEETIEYKPIELEL